MYADMLSVYDHCDDTDGRDYFNVTAVFKSRSTMNNNAIVIVRNDRFLSSL